MPIRLIVLTGSDRPEVLTTWNHLLSHVQQKSEFEIVGAFPRNKSIPEGLRADYAVVIGGDGSMLRGCRQLGHRQIPIIGVNLGRLGFLTDLTPDQFLQNLQMLCSGDFTVSEHLMFECRLVCSDGTVRTSIGLNEVTLAGSQPLRMLDIALCIDGRPVTTFSCDGLIISTPVGSTAHNLSAGGPILRQDLQAFCITPICPHTLTVRPIVDSAARTYELSARTADRSARVIIDGQVQYPLGEGDRVIVTRATTTFKVVRFPGHSYYGTLHRKLGWQGQLDYRERRGVSGEVASPDSPSADN